MNIFFLIFLRFFNLTNHAVLYPIIKHKFCHKIPKKLNKNTIKNIYFNYKSLFIHDYNNLKGVLRKILARRNSVPEKYYEYFRAV